MKKWILISPDGVTNAPYEERVENFQVLGFVLANSGQDALIEFKDKYHYLSGCGFNETWIYPLESKTPYIAYIEEGSDEEEFEDEEERVIVEKIIYILKEHGFTDIIYDYRSDNSYNFEAYSDAMQEIRVDIEGEKISVYDRYITEKHYVHFGDFNL